VTVPEAARVPWHLNFSNWFILAGVIGALVIGWLALGQPGTALKDGAYGCKTPPQGGVSIGGPGATVEAGKVVDAWEFDIVTGIQTSVPFDDVERRDSAMFTMTSVAEGGYEYLFECRFSG